MIGDNVEDSGDWKAGMDVYFRSRGEKLYGTLYGSSNVGVILCPPHPLYGGSRNDTRIVRIAWELSSHNITAFCIDYGSYGHGKKEIEDVLNAISYFRDKVKSLCLLGYSFGAVVASNSANVSNPEGFVALSISKKVGNLEAVVDFDCPKLFVHGKYDAVAPYSNFEDLFLKAKGKKEKLVLETDHFYLENYPKIINLASKRIREFFEKLLHSRII